MPWTWEWEFDRWEHTWTWRWVWEQEEGAGPASNTQSFADWFWNGPDGGTGGTEDATSQGWQDWSGWQNGWQEGWQDNQQQPSQAGWNFSERAEEDTGPAKDRAKAPEPVADTGSTSTPTSPTKGRGKRGGPSALRQNQPLERAYRQHAAQRWADDLPRVSRSSFNRNRSRPPRAVRQAAKAKAAGPSSSEQPTPSAVSSSGAQSSTEVPRPAGVRQPPPKPDRRGKPQLTQGTGTPRDPDPSHRESLQAADPTEESYSYYTVTDEEPPPLEPATASAPPEDEPEDSDDSTSSSQEVAPASTPSASHGRPLDADDMTPWSRRISRKTTAIKSLARPPLPEEDTESSPPGQQEVLSPTSPAEDPTGSSEAKSEAREMDTTPEPQALAQPAAPSQPLEGSPVPEARLQQAGPKPEPGGTEDALRLDVECATPAFSTWLRIPARKSAEGAKLLAACRGRSGISALSTLRPWPTGPPLNLDQPLGVQLAEGTTKLLAHTEGIEASAEDQGITLTLAPKDEPAKAPSPDRASEEATAASPPQAGTTDDKMGDGSPLPAYSQGAQAEDLPTPMHTETEGVAATPLSSQHPVQPTLPPPVTSADGLTCLVCGISTASTEHMGSHLMTAHHVRRLPAYFASLRDPAREG